MNAKSLSHPHRTAPTPRDPALTVFHDGACPLCRAEIAFYRRQRGAEKIAFVDVAREDTALPEGVSRTSARARFHVETAQGQVISGAAAFLALMATLPRLAALCADRRAARNPPAARRALSAVSSLPSGARRRVRAAAADEEPMTRVVTNDGASRIPAVRVAILAAALAAVGVPLYIHLPRFASAELGLTLGQIGALLGLIRVVDFVQDPLLGRLTDRFAAHRGRFATLALGGLAVGVVWVFAVVPAQGGVGALAAALALTFTAYSLGTLLLYGQSVSIAGSDAPAAQLRLAGARELGILAGVALGAMGPQLLGLAFPDAGGYPAFACAAAALAIVAAWASRPLWHRPVALSPPPNLGTLLRSGAGWVLTLAFVNGLPVAVTTTLFIFFVDQRLGLSHLAGAFLVLFFAAGGLSAPAWARAATRYGPRPVLAGAMCLAIASFVWAYALPSGAALSFAVIAAASGVAVGADGVILTSLLASTLGRAGLPAGQAFGLWSFLAKASLALAAAVMLPVLGLVGFDPAGTDDAAALDALNAAYALVPCALKILSLALLAFLPRDLFTGSAQTETTSPPEPSQCAEPLPRFCVTAFC
ncbi:MFS transporter [Ruegeria marisrubri]|uniref:MFS transporter n=1 Tax=Ruegeria marisrubri TaxID=1685379 RepID=UPI0009E8EFF0|nr:MFS transporter [Ruegeria marisrubri]